jgi:hypothetical protein
MTDDIEREGEELHVDPSIEPNPDEPIEGADELPETVADGDVETDHGHGDELNED